MKRDQVEKAIEDRIAKWHDSESKLKLHEYLGWSEEEYKIYVQECAIPVREFRKKKN